MIATVWTVGLAERIISLTGSFLNFSGQDEATAVGTGLPGHISCQSVLSLTLDIGVVAVGHLFFIVGQAVTKLLVVNPVILERQVEHGEGGISSHVVSLRIKVHILKGTYKSSVFNDPPGPLP